MKWGKRLGYVGTPYPHDRSVQSRQAGEDASTASGEHAPGDSSFARSAD